MDIHAVDDGTINVAPAVGPEIDGASSSTLKEGRVLAVVIFGRQLYVVIISLSVCECCVATLSHRLRKETKDDV